jgi:2-dehydropantoate 2-reductase
MIKNVAIIGVGGVGGFFGGKLCQLLEHRPELGVSFVARGEHLRVIQKAGLTLKTEDHGELLCRPSLATDNFESLPSLDLCLVSVKQFDLTSALLRLKPKIRSDTIILPLLNGIDIYSRVRSIVASGVVLPACVYVGTHIESAGVITQRGGACKILFGPDPSRPDWSPGELLALFDQAKIKSEWTMQVQAEIWKKFTFISAYGLVCAAHNKTVGQILDDPALKEEVQSVIQEALSLATAAGVNLPPNIGTESFEKARGFPHETKTSFQRDFERFDRADERDLFAGAMIKMADELKIEVGTTRKISAHLDRIKPTNHVSR